MNENIKDTPFDKLYSNYNNQRQRIIILSKRYFKITVKKYIVFLIEKNV